MRIAAVALIFLLISSATAHERYPADCCANRDCHPINCDEIKVIDGNYVWHDMTFKDVRTSPDGRCHACYFGWTPMCIMPGGTT